MNHGDSGTFWSHINELRNRTLESVGVWVVCFCLCYFFSEPIYGFLLSPLIKIEKDDPEFYLIYTDLTETFFVYLKVALIASLLICMPFFMVQIYRFMAPGLYKSEKKAALYYIFFTPFLFLLGIASAYYYIFPLAWHFSISLSENSEKTVGIKIEFMPSVSEYLDLVLQMLFAFGMAFQLPVILATLCYIGIVQVSSLRKFRRFAIVMIFTIAAILTPPDVFSQIGLAVPMIVLYEISILVCAKISKSQKN